MYGQLRQERSAVSMWWPLAVKCMGRVDSWVEDGHYVCRHWGAGGFRLLGQLGPLGSKRYIGGAGCA